MNFEPFILNVKKRKVQYILRKNIFICFKSLFRKEAKKQFELMFNATRV